MKKTVLFAFVLSLIFNVNGFASGTKRYGKKLTLKDTTKVSKILETPEKFVGKKVLISGLIVDVCKMRGCWIDLASDKKFEKIRVKVNDGEIVFPITAKGQNAVVEGEVEELKLTKEQVIAMKKHQAEENDTEFDPSTVKSGKTIYRIKGLGAVIEK